MTGPAAIKDVVLWLRAKDLGAGGSTVASWPDASGSGRAGAGAGAPVVVAGATPAGGKAVSFTAAGDLFTLPTLALPVDASSFISSSYVPANAVDGNTATAWSSMNVDVSGPQWLRVHLAAAYAATSYTIAPRSGATLDGPKDFTLEGSNDGGDTWDVLDTRIGVTWPTAAAQTFTFTNATAYRWYRLHVTAAGTYVQVSEFSIPGATLASAAGEVWLVVKGNATNGSANTSWTLGTGAQSYYGYNTSQTIYDTTGVGTRQQFNATMPVNGQWRLIRVTSDGTWTFYLDGTQQATATLAPAWPAQGTLRLRNGQIAEVLARGEVSSSDEVATLIGYFNTEHGLSVPGGAALTPHGAASGALNWSGGAHGASQPLGSASGSFGWVGSAAGAITGSAHGSASGSFGWSGTAGSPNRVEPWTADLSRRTRLVLVTSGGFEATPPLELPPDGFVERPIIRKSLTVPDLSTLATIVDGGSVSALDYGALEDAAVVEEIGVPHVIIGNHDVTYFRGGLTSMVSFQAEEPFGDLSATIEVPQITSYDEFPDDSNVHPLNWSRIRANVYIVLKRPDGSQVKVWGGHVVSHDTGNDEGGTTKRLTCVGSLWQASTDIHKVPTMLDPTDIGTLVPKALNEVASRRYPAIPKVTTGIMSRQRGSWSDSPLAYAQGLLATAFTASGNQWTVAKVPNTWRRYEMRKKSEAPSWTVTNGARGVSVDLTRDGAAVRNVIYGHGVGPDGYAWWNYHYPNLRMDDAPVFPGVIMSAGSTDANSNGGVSLWQARARDLGYRVDVDGTLTSGDVTTIKALQRKYGVQVDGQIGPQTWAATFDVGGNGGDLSGAIRLPLAADPRTQKWLYNGDGSIAGPNPAYDKNHLIYAADVDFGSGTTREQGLEDAQLIVEREQDPAITGRIVLRSDPREGSRILIRPGDKLRLIGYEGADRVLHIARVDFDMDSQAMTLEVDERGRDAMTLTQIRERNKEARRDPARRPGNVNRRSRLDVDSVVPFDGESGAGRIPRFAVYGGLWSVIRVPVSSLGRIASVDVSTSGPAAEFVMGLFGEPVTPAHLLREVGNPFASDDPFNKDPAQARRLDDDLGFIEGFGSKSSPAGYWPKQKGDGPLTGKLVDTGGVEYVSAKPPWVWVAVYSPTTTFVSGRLLPAPIQ